MSRREAVAGADRFAARSRRRRLRKLLASSVVVGVAGIAGAVAWFAGWSDITEVSGTEVTGAGPEVAEAVREAAGVREGVQLISVDTEAITERVRAVPDVAEAEVRRGWPATVEIEVTVRRPAAVLRDGDTWWSVDRTGVVFGGSAERVPGLAEIVAPDGADDTEVGARMAAIEVAEGLPAALDGQVATIDAPSEAAIELVLADGRRIVWGTSAETGRKADVLAVLMEEVPDASGYNVSSTAFPTADS